MAYPDWRRRTAESFQIRLLDYLIILDFPVFLLS
jgi:hypothetical protein